MDIKVVGIDLAKNIFQVCVWKQDGTVARNRKVTRNKLLHTIRQFPEKTLIAMEACGTAHHWARQFMTLGHDVILIPAQHVKPLVGYQINDANDALAIFEAAFRLGIHPVPVKSIEQQDIKSLRCVRSRLVEQRTATANQVRCLAAEYGVSFPVGIRNLKHKLPECLEGADNGLSFVLRWLLQGLYDDIVLDRDIEYLTDEITNLCKVQPRYKALLPFQDSAPLWLRHL